MNLLLFVGAAFLTVVPPQEPELNNTTLRGTRVPAKVVVCRSQWGTPMLPYGRSEGGKWGLSRAALEVIAAETAKESENQKKEKQIQTIEVAISELTKVLASKNQELIQKEASVQSSLNQKIAEIKKKKEEVAKQEGEFAQTDTPLEQARLEATQDIAALQNEQRDIEQQLRSLQVSQSDFTSDSTPLGKELNALKALALKLKNQLGYSLTAQPDSDLIERSLIQPPKGETAADFGLIAMREFNIEDDKGSLRPLSDQIVPYRPRKRMLP